MLRIHPIFHPIKLNFSSNYENSIRTHGTKWFTWDFGMMCTVHNLRGGLPPDCPSLEAETRLSCLSVLRGLSVLRRPNRPQKPVMILRSPSILRAPGVPSQRPIRPAETWPSLSEAHPSSEARPSQLPAASCTLAFRGRKSLCTWSSILRMGIRERNQT